MLELYLGSQMTITISSLIISVMAVTSEKKFQQDYGENFSAPAAVLIRVRYFALAPSRS